ncbi:MAG TPA: hypothetical protein VK489_05825 [Ferruginibacter sp.]|nr:hypothetical protein [Ferruginibacter sp.]
MKIRQFQELYSVVTSTDTSVNFGLDKASKMICAVHGKTMDQVDKMPMAKFNRLCVETVNYFEALSKSLLKNKPKKYVYVKGRIYQINYRVDQENTDAAKHIEFLSYGKDVIPNLHKIMAFISTPIKWSWGRFIPYERSFGDIANDFKHVPFNVAYQASAFFYTHYRAFLEIYQPKLIRELMKKGMKKEEATAALDASLSVMDTFEMPAWTKEPKEYLLNRFSSN